MRAVRAAQTYSRFSKLSGDEFQVVRVEDNAKIALVRTSEKSVVVTDPFNRPIMYSEIDGNHMFHTDFYGMDVGRTYVDANEDVQSQFSTNKHFDLADRLIGRDEIDDQKGIVTHYDGAKFIGRSKIIPAKNTNSVIADAALEQLIREFNESPMMRNEKLRKLLDRKIQSRKTCRTTMDRLDCAKARLDTLQYLETLSSSRF